MQTIVCSNDTDSLLKGLQDYLDNGGIIRNIRKVDTASQQIVILISDKDISENEAEIWYAGYMSGLKNALG